MSDSKKEYRYAWFKAGHCTPDMMTNAVDGSSYGYDAVQFGVWTPWGPARRAYAHRLKGTLGKPNTSYLYYLIEEVRDVETEDSGKYIVWCPTSEKPPTTIMTAKQARVVAEKMSKDNPDAEFFVAKLTGKVKTPKVVVPPSTWEKA